MAVGKLLSLLFSPQSQGNTAREFEHINREMYAKNLELAERNKTLSLVRQIDEIILGSVTNPNEIAAQVTHLLVNEGGFRLVSISTINSPEKSLDRIGMTESKALEASRMQIAPQVSHILRMPFANAKNIAVQAVNERTVKSSSKIGEVFLYDLPIEQLQKMQENAGIKSFVVYPLIVREYVIGTMMIGLEETQDAMSEYQRDLLVRLVGVIGIAIDNALLYNEVQETNKKLKELDKLKDDFVSLASHELRTPMTAIKSYLWMALDGRGGALTEKQKYYLDRSYKSTDRLINLVNDMLNISRIESGRITLELQPVKLDDLTKEVIEEIAPRSQELGITLSVVEHSVLPEVFIDPDKIKQVYINIIGNSLKFTPTGGKVIISMVQKDQMITVQIADTGVGIPPEDLPKLFQKFGMMLGSYSGSKSVQGTGLGLYISKAIVTLHHGQMWATSEGRGKGTQFAFTLPVATPADRQKYESMPKNPAVPRIGLEKSQI